MPFLEKALALALDAHRGAVDKAGAPYIFHPLRVALSLTGDAVIVGLLHDVLEDSSMTVTELAGTFPPEIVTAVVALTKQQNEPRLAYYERVKANPLALKVKLADIADNLGRVAELPPELRERLTAKYELALSILKG